MSPAWGAAPSSQLQVQHECAGVGGAWAGIGGLGLGDLAPTWHDALLALLASRRVLLRVALSAEQLVLLGSERLVHQGAPAPRAVETGLVPVPVLVRQVLQTRSRETET